jgi:tryptophan synthase alpha chain
LSRISESIQKRLKQDEKVFVAYITAGDPNLEVTKQLCEDLSRAGVDIIELGVPFSDPIADGPTNQRAAQRALESGTTLAGIFGLVAKLREGGFQTPIVLFSYLNPIFRMGYENFAQKAKEVGVDGVLCVDLPSEESQEYRGILRSAGIDTIFLATPTSDSKRLKVIDEASSGFVYYVSRTGVTGAQASISDTLEIELEKVRNVVKHPLLIGFGISDANQAREIASWGDGAVIGSAIVGFVEQWNTNPNARSDLQRFLAEVRTALSD